MTRENIYGGEYLSRKISTANRVLKYTKIPAQACERCAGSAAFDPALGERVWKYREVGHDTIGSAVARHSHAQQISSLISGLLLAVFLPFSYGLQDTDGDGYSDPGESCQGYDPENPASRPLDQWTRRMPVFLRNAPAATMTNAPLLLTLNHERINYAEFKPDGSDLRFTDTDGHILDMQIERWNPAGNSYVWVRIPQLNETCFYMHWGNEHATSYNSGRVWLAYNGVYHLDDQDFIVRDATGSRCHGDNKGTRSVIGKIGYAQDFSGSSTIYLSPIPFAHITDEVTVSFWQYANDLSQPGIVLDARSERGRYQLFFYLPHNANQISWYAFEFDRLSMNVDVASLERSWNFWALTKNRNTGMMKIYLNGELLASDALHTNVYIPILQEQCTLGGTASGGTPYNGLLDEFRVSSTEKSADWIRMQYLSMTDQLLIYGDQIVTATPLHNGSEPDVPGKFRLLRSGPTTLPLNVFLKLSGSATPHLDFITVDSVVIPAGSSSFEYTLTTLDDDLVESEETVELAFAQGNYRTENASFVLTIKDDDVDSDADGMADAWERLHFNGLERNGSLDADQDRLNDLLENRYGSDPFNQDTDGDGLLDGDEVLIHASNPCKIDSDADGLPDAWEIAHSFNPANPEDAMQDADGDGILNLNEYLHNLDPHLAHGDSDGEGLPDLEEIALYHTNVRLGDSNQNGTPDGVPIIHLAGCDTSRRIGRWHENNGILEAETNINMRAEYLLDIDHPGIHRLQVTLSNIHPERNKSFHFRLEMLMDGIPFQWLNIDVPKNSTATSVIITPWLNKGQHSLRLAWYYQNNKRLLAIHGIEVWRIDGADHNSDTIQDWMEPFLEHDTDADSLRDQIEVKTALNPLRVDSDGDMLGDGEEQSLFGTNPRAYDTDQDGLPDARIILEKNGIDTSLREFWHRNSIWIEDGESLITSGNFNNSAQCHYDLNIEEAACYRLGLRIRNYRHDPPDRHTFKIKAFINKYYIGMFHIFADVDLAGVGYLNTPWITPGVHRITLKWFNEAEDQGRNADLAIEKLMLIAVDGADNNDNGMQDWMETLLRSDADTDADGLSDYDEVVLHRTNPVLRDSDADGLDDMEEILRGCDPNNPDTDGDGVSDGIEALELNTDPLTREFDGTSQLTLFKDGCETNNTCGIWRNWGREVVSFGTRGYVEYEIDCPSSDIYRLRIIAAHMWNRHSCFPVPHQDTSKLMLYIDGVYIGERTLVSKDREFKDLAWHTPWMTRGRHTLRLFWDNTSETVYLRLKQLCLETREGPDDNQNGVKDWVEKSMANMTGIDKGLGASSISPVCLEGKARYVEMMKASSSPICQAVGDRWYAHIDLLPDVETGVDLSFQNGGRIVHAALKWAPLDVSSQVRDLVLHVGSSVKFGALRNSAIHINGMLQTTLPLDRDQIVRFDQAGDYTVEVYQDASRSHAFNVLVFETFLPQADPAFLLGEERSWPCPDLPREILLETDPTVQLERDADTLWMTMWKLGRPHVVQTRLYEHGPITASKTLKGFWLQAAVDNFVRVIERYDDGSALWENRLVAKQVPDSVAIELKIFVGGVTFDDMSIERWITNKDFDEKGEYVFRLIKAGSVKASICHTIKAYQDGVYLGEAYYSGVLMPEQ